MKFNRSQSIAILALLAISPFYKLTEKQIAALEVLFPGLDTFRDGIGETFVTDSPIGTALELLAAILESNGINGDTDNVPHDEYHKAMAAADAGDLQPFANMIKESALRHIAE